MKKRILLICTAGLLTANLSIPAAGVSLANMRNTLTATPAVQGQTYNEPDAKGTVSFQNLQSRMRTENLAIKSLQASLESKTVFDRKQAYDDLVKGLSYLTDNAFALLSKGSDISAYKANIESMRNQIDSLKEENYTKTMEKLSLQINLSTQQLILGGEKLYFNIISSESTLSDLNRNLKTMERNIKETELRYALGQVSQLTLQELNAKYTNLKSQTKTLELTIEKTKASLQVLLGESPTGKLTLSPLPSVSQKQTTLLTVKYDTALQIAKEKSLTLNIAKRTLADAEETWKDAQDDYAYGGYQYKVADQTYRSAVYTYDSTVKDFELSFQNLYQAIPDAQQALEAAEATLSYQQQNYAVAQVKYQQGQLSDSALLSAEDAVLTAKSSVSVEQQKVFTTWNNYQWALERGMIG